MCCASHTIPRAARSERRVASGTAAAAAPFRPLDAAASAQLQAAGERERAGPQASLESVSAVATESLLCGPPASWAVDRALLFRRLSLWAKAHAAVVEILGIAVRDHTTTIGRSAAQCDHGKGFIERPLWAKRRAAQARSRCVKTRCLFSPSPPSACPAPRLPSSRPHSEQRGCAELQQQRATRDATQQRATTTANNTSNHHRTPVLTRFHACSSLVAHTHSPRLSAARSLACARSLPGVARR